MNNKIKVKLRNIKGNILTMGFDPENKVIKILEKNNKINEFHTLTNKGITKGNVPKIPQNPHKYVPCQRRV